MLYEQKCTFSFKGERTYVQGADIFDAVIALTRNVFGKYPSMINGSFYKLLPFNALFSIYENIEPRTQNTCYALFSIHFDQKKYQIKVTAAQDRVRSSRVYNEDQVLDGVVITKNKINMVVKNSYSYMEQIVAMTKELHFTAYTHAYGKWLFTKISLKEIVNPILFINKTLLIETKKNFHNKLTQNAIYLDNSYIGDIWYSLKT